MHAILPTTEHSNARNLDNDKERVNTLRAVASFNGGGLRTIVEARFYMARRSDGASPIYCSLWIHGNCHASGYGKAGGYGYHKQSAALSEAIDSAGVKLMGDQYGRDKSPEREARPARIDGCGDSSMRDAIDAIARAAGAVGDVLVE